MMLLRKVRDIFQRPECIFSYNNRPQLLATLTANIIFFSHGISVGWLSPTLIKLQSPDSPLNFIVAVTEVSWIGSLVGIGSFIGNILFSFLLEFAGRKPCSLMIAVPHMCLWILTYTASRVEFLYMARFCGGMTGGGGFCVLSMFVSEIADTRIRGALASMLMFFMNFGIMVGLVFATYLHYHLIPLIAIALPVIYLITIAMFPETPLFLLRKGRFVDAEKSFKFYRNCTRPENANKLQTFTHEFDELKAAITKNKTDERLSYKDFVNKNALKAFMSTTVLITINQFCGIFAFVNYMSSIFAAANSILNPNTSAIVTGCVQILGSLSAIICVDRFGRKPLILFSVGGMSLSLALFGLYTYLSGLYDIDKYNWLPLLLMTVFIFVGNSGIVAVTFVIIVEIFPAKIRHIAVSYSLASLSLMVFAVLKIFPIYLDHFGMSITMWSFASVNCAGFIYFLLFLPETKGRSLAANE